MSCILHPWPISHLYNITWLLEFLLWWKHTLKKQILFNVEVSTKQGSCSSWNCHLLCSFFFFNFFNFLNECPACIHPPLDWYWNGQNTRSFVCDANFDFVFDILLLLLMLLLLLWRHVETYCGAACLDLRRSRKMIMIIKAAWLVGHALNNQSELCTERSLSAFLFLFFYGPPNVTYNNYNN